jgi:DNA-binding NarL/FixJ family response regulator
VKILVCDDHALFREGLRGVLAELEGGATQLLEASDGAAALALADSQPDLDLVLLDLQMPGMDGWAGLRRFRSRHPTLPVVIVSASEELADVRAALGEGASGFIPKGSTGGQLIAALRLVLSGGVYVPAAALAEAAPDGGGIAAERARLRRERASELTPRQLEVLALVARGLTNREICGVLDIAEGTVKAHVAAIFEALGASNRTEAAVLARELGLRAPGEEV